MVTDTHSTHTGVVQQSSIGLPSVIFPGGNCVLDLMSIAISRSYIDRPDGDAARPHAGQMQGLVGDGMRYTTNTLRSDQGQSSHLH